MDSPNSNAAEASHLGRIVRGFLLWLVTAWRRNDRFSPTALESSTAFAKARCRFVLLRLRTCDRRGGQRPVPAQRSGIGGGGRNAPETSCACASAGFPPAIHPRESPDRRWLCRNHSASSGTLTFRCTHSPSHPRPQQYKNHARLCRNCGG
jgi:hypothetical protein